MTLYKLILAIHVIVCLALIVVVLLQSSKGGGLAGAFGGGGGQTIFGGQETATFLSKATTYLAVLFMVLSLSLAVISAKRSPATAGSKVKRQQPVRRDVIPKGRSIDEVMGTTALDTVPADSQ